MAEDQDRSQKTEAPSQRRLDDARRKGDVAKSADVPQVMALFGATLALLTLGGPLARGMSDSLRPFLERPDTFDLTGAGGVDVMRVALRAALPAGLVMGAAVTAGVVGNVLQTGLIWATDKLAPDASRVSPFKGFERLFGIDGLVQFAKTLLKVMAVGIAAWAILNPRAAALAQLAQLDPAAMLPVAMEWMRALLIAVLVVMGTTAGADWLWQRYRFMVRMRMTREEVKEDHKDSEGDPHIKAKLKQKRAAMSRRRMMQAVPKATLVVMNPTHYAVALRYVQGETAAPVCVAKGLDATALRIRAIAEGANVPVVEDPPLARALYATMDVDETIPREHYQAVAKIIGFILGQAERRRSARARPPRPAGLASR